MDLCLVGKFVQARDHLIPIIVITVVVSGFGLIQPEIESDPTRADLGRIRIQFFSQIGSDFGSE